MELKNLLAKLETKNAVLDVVADKVESWQEKLSLPMNDDQLLTPTKNDPNRPEITIKSNGI